MIRIAICDDDAFSLKSETEFIKEYMNQKEQTCDIRQFVSGTELLKFLDCMEQYDIIFLDIEMNDINGIETAKKIRRYNDKVYIVFITAFMMYSLDGYQANAFRYILKDSATFETVLKECLDAILLNRNYLKKKIKFKFREGILDLFPEDILYIESVAHQVRFQVFRGDTLMTYTQYKKLDMIEMELEHCGFCRIHKSYLINMRYVKHVYKTQVELKTGICLNIAKSKSEGVRDTIANYLGEM